MFVGSDLGVGPNRDTPQDIFGGGRRATRSLASKISILCRTPHYRPLEGNFLPLPGPPLVSATGKVLSDGTGSFRKPACDLG